MTRFEVLIFDFDGLILDTETPELRSWQEEFETHGVSLALEDWADCVGRKPGSFDPCELLIERSGKDLDRAAILAVVRKRIHERIDREELRPGVVSWLKSAAELEMRCGVVSSSGHDWVEPRLRMLGIHDRFDLFICHEDVERHKPDPLPYLTAVERLGSRPERTIVVEDSPNGARAATAAGCRTVVVPNEVTASLDFPEGVIRLDSLSECTLEALIERLSAREESWRAV